MITLTVAEIIDLAGFAGFVLDPSQLADTDADERASEITIEQCPPKGLRDDDGAPRHYVRIAYFAEYPEEGAIGLGDEISQEVAA